MKPYLNLYLTAYYSLIPKIKTDAKYRLTKKLKEFQKFNPLFGRKIVVFKNSIKNGKLIKRKSCVDFNYNHKKFNITNSENFMNNHLTYKYNDDNINDDDDTDEYYENEENDENIFETNAASRHHTMTNFNLFRFYIIRRTTENLEENNQSEEDEETIEESNLESDSGSELEEDFYEEMPDEDSIS